MTKQQWIDRVGVDVLAALAEASGIRVSIEKRGKKFVDPGGWNIAVYRGGGSSHWWASSLKKARKEARAKVMELYADRMAEESAQRQRNVLTQEVSRWTEKSRKDAATEIAKRRPWKRP